MTSNEFTVYSIEGNVVIQRLAYPLSLSLVSISRLYLSCIAVMAETAKSRVLARAMSHSSPKR